MSEAKKVPVTRDFLESLIALTNVTAPKLGASSYQNYILVNLPKDKIVATNGHALAQRSLKLEDRGALEEILPVSHKDKFEGRVILNALDCAELKTLLKDKKETRFFIQHDLQGSEGAIFFGNSKGSTVIVYIGNYFPKYEAVLPSESKATCELAFDLTQLKDLFKAMEKQEKYAKKEYVTIKFYNGMSPMIIKHGLNGMGNINVLMPFKVD